MLPDDRSKERRMPSVSPRTAPEMSAARVAGKRADEHASAFANGRPCELSDTEFHQCCER